MSISKYQRSLASKKNQNIVSLSKCKNRPWFLQRVCYLLCWCYLWLVCNLVGAPDGGVWIPYPARKLSHFPHSAVVIWSYPSSLMTFFSYPAKFCNQFQIPQTKKVLSRIPRNSIGGPVKGAPPWGFAGCGIRPFLVVGYGIGSKIVAG